MSSIPPSSAAPSPEARDRPPTPVIVHLSGRLRGATRRLRGDHLVIGGGPGADVPLDREEIGQRAAAESNRPLARLERRGASYRLVSSGLSDLWVNGERVVEMTLASGDVIEIGQGGPVLRFRLYSPSSRAYKTVGEAFSDCVDCARTAGGAARRTGALLGGVAREMMTQTAPWVRVAATVVLVALMAATAGMWSWNLRLARRVEAQTVRIRGLSAVLERAGDDRIALENLARDRAELDRRIAANLQRLRALEGRSGARLRAIEASSASVVFLQGGYGFADPESGRVLRFLGAGPGGGPVRGPDGTPLLTFDGDGPEVEVLYTGTGFVVSTSNLLLSNRHVALPWEFDDSVRGILAQGLVPLMRRFIGYLPGRAEPFAVELVRASDRADVALLRAETDLAGVPPLPLADRTPAAGDEVVVLGYPAGIQALVVRADPALVNTLMQTDADDFWSVAAALSRAGYIAPLATMGIVGQVTRSSVVYDATTTHGGSGGPVIGLDGKVVAVNAAIITDFGGSNLGVPISEVRLLLEPAAGSD